MSRRRLISPGQPQAAVSVSTIELLFDLVFVFVISQTAHVVESDSSPAGLARAFVTLALVWWIYHGYAWLTNLIAPHSTITRLVLIAAMAAFLCLGLALPDAFGGGGVVFGVAYLVVAVLHVFLLDGVGGSADDRHVAWFNIVGAIALVVAGFVTGWVDWVLFLVPFGFFALSAREASRSDLSVGASHFVERHGLFMLIAFGESIVSVGSGLGEGGHDDGVGLPVVVGAVASVALVASLWWTYFSSSEGDAESMMARFTARRRTTVGLTGFGLCHLAMLFGLICAAAGITTVMVDAFAPVDQVGAALLAGGVGTYLVFNGEFRRELCLYPAASRGVSALVCAGTGMLHRFVPGVALVAVLSVVVAIMLLVEDRLLSRPGGRAPADTMPS